MKTIFALGDHAPADVAVNKYIVDVCGKPSPKLCFIGTATGDSPTYPEAIDQNFAPFGCITKSLGLFNLPTADLRGYLLDSDIIYVGGGNTRSMLAVWREWGVDIILREAWEQGIVLCGPSAGSICWFEQGTTDSVPGDLTTVNGLGFLPYSHSPHYDGEPKRRPAYQRMIGDGTLKAGYAADDLVGLLFHDTKLAEVVSAKPNAKAYWVESVEGNVVETAIEPTILL